MNPTFAPQSTPTPQFATTYMQSPLAPGSSVVVVGAGAFGGWTALYLLRKGINVTLVDVWGAGNSRSSSGDETRVIRSTYGGNELYFDLNVRALELWKENEQRFRTQLFHQTGVLWFCYQAHEPMIEDSMPFMKKHGLAYEYISKKDAKRQYSQINTDDLDHLMLDREAGYLKAREGAMAVFVAFLREGGRYIKSAASPRRNTHGEVIGVDLSIGDEIEADAYLFACGAWLPSLFRQELGELIKPTKQEAYYLGVPAKVAALFDIMPVWVDLDGTDFYYGIPNNAGRGFKVGVDLRGEAIDPTSADRLPNPDTLQKARAFMQHRFPALQNAPLVENRVCQYENSPDGNFIFDRLPHSPNCWILGGGSGHGYKHGPALGELVADIWMGAKPLEPLFLLDRFR